MTSRRTRSLPPARCPRGGVGRAQELSAPTLLFRQQLPRDRTTGGSFGRSFSSGGSVLGGDVAHRDCEWRPAAGSVDVSPLRQVEQQGERLADSQQVDGAGVADHGGDATGGDGADMLALGG